MPSSLSPKPSSTSPPPQPTSSSRAPLRSSPDPPFYQSHSSTPRTSVSQTRAGNGKSRTLSHHARNDSEQDSTSIDDFFEDDDDQDYYEGDRDGGASRPFLQQRSSTSSSLRKSRSVKKRSNSIKMKRSNSHRLADQYNDDETAAKSAGNDSNGIDTASGSSPRGNSSSGGEVSRGPDDMSLDDIFDPTKTLRENKSMMISAELDRMGMASIRSASGSCADAATLSTCSGRRRSD